MCKKTNFKHCPSTIDKCMKNLIQNLNQHFVDIKTVASCCGHNKYLMTILVKDKHGNVWDICSNTIIPRKKRFYKKDKKGYYYIPEVSEPLK